MSALGHQSRYQAGDRAILHQKWRSSSESECSYDSNGNFVDHNFRSAVGVLEAKNEKIHLHNWSILALLGLDFYCRNMDLIGAIEDLDRIDRDCYRGCGRSGSCVGSYKCSLFRGTFKYLSSLLHLTKFRHFYGHRAGWFSDPNDRQFVGMFEL